MKIHFSHKSDEWGTPQELFDELNREFYFELDVAATQENSKCPVYIDLETDATTQEWSKSNWCNPPYSRVREFTAKAAEEAKKGNLTVMLIPARTDTRFFHDHIYKKRKVETRFLKGRLKFINPTGGLLRGTSMNGSNNAAPFPSMLVIFRP